MYSFHMLEENNKISGVSLSQLEMLNKEFIILMLVISTIYLLVIGFTSGIVQQVLIKTISLVPVVKIIAALIIIQDFLFVVFGNGSWSKFFKIFSGTIIIAFLLILVIIKISNYFQKGELTR